MNYKFIKTILILIMLLPFTVQAGNSGDKKQLADKNTVTQQATSSGCSAYADCVDGSRVSCSTTTSGDSCQAADQYCRRTGGSSGGWATCGDNESHCNSSSCPPPRKSECELKYEGKWCKNRDSYCGRMGSCHNNVCECA